MADANELTGANKFLYEKLHGDGTIAALVATRIYEDGNQPELGPYPLIVWSWIPAPDTPGLGSVRLLANPIAQIKLITKGLPTDGDKAVANKIDDLFQNISNEASEGISYTSRRRIPIRRPQRGNNPSEVFWHLGGQYQFRIYPL